MEASNLKGHRQSKKSSKIKDLLQLNMKMKMTKWIGVMMTMMVKMKKQKKKQQNY
jgi:hypothetical protein